MIGYKRSIQQGSGFACKDGSWVITLCQTLRELSIKNNISHSVVKTLNTSGKISVHIAQEQKN